jgi:hypothetical protein
MAVYIGVDFHARQQTISYLTTEAGEIRQLELLHEDPAKVRAFYEQFAGQRVIVGFESSGYAAWFEELLEELGCEIWIGHATYIRQFAKRRQKNDRRDADLILELLFERRLSADSSLFPEHPADAATTALSAAAGEDAHHGREHVVVHGQQSGTFVSHSVAK